MARKVTKKKATKNQRKINAEELEKSNQQKGKEKEQRQRRNEVEHEIMAAKWAERGITHCEEALDYYRYEVNAVVSPVLIMGKRLLDMFDSGCADEIRFDGTKTIVVRGLAVSLGHCAHFIRELSNETDSAFLSQLPGKLKEERGGS